MKITPIHLSLIMAIVSASPANAGESTPPPSTPSATGNASCPSCRCIDPWFFQSKTARAGKKRMCDFSSLPGKEAERARSFFPKLLATMGLQRNMTVPDAARNHWQRLRDAMTSAELGRAVSCGDHPDGQGDTMIDELIRRCIEDQILSHLVLNVVMALQASQTAEGGKAGSRRHRIPEAMRPAYDVCMEDSNFCIAAFQIVRLDNAATVAALAQGDRLQALLRERPDLADTFFLIVQHADNVPEWQASMLPIFEELGRQGLVPSPDLARLTDRVMGKKEGKQRYGTQVRCENGRAVPDPPLDAARSKVDERRLAIGLQPLAAYLEEIGNAYCH